MAKKIMHFAEYEERIIGLPSISLRYIISDATEAIAAQPLGENAGYYQDEIMICGQELSRRIKPRKRTNRESEYHNTLTEIAVILKNAGHEPREMIGDLRKATKEDYQAKYNELVEAVLLWAKTPGNHGGNPYGHSFMKLVPWKESR